MFGILYTIYSALGITGHKAKEAYHAEVRKQKAINNNDDTYTDAKGKTRYIKNDRWVCFSQVNGHRVLKDCLNDKVYIDYTENNENERCIKEKAEAIKQGNTVYLFIEERNISKSDPWKGHRYKDIETGKVYVIRKCLVNASSNDWCEFYVDISNGMYIRKTDLQVEKDKKWISKLTQIREDKNELLKKMTRNKNISKEEYENKLSKMINHSINVINSRFISDDNVEEYIRKLNEKQLEYKNNNDDMYYGVQVLGR